MKIFALIITTLFVSQAFATKYYQSSGDNIAEISEQQFGDCKKVWYRKSGADGLNRKHKKNLVKASLRAEAINSLEAVKNKLLAHSGSCTYGADDESFN